MNILFGLAAILLLLGCQSDGEEEAEMEQMVNLDEEDEYEIGKAIDQKEIAEESLEKQEILLIE